MRNISGFMMRSTQKNFAAEGRPAWPEWAVSTPEARETRAETASKRKKKSKRSATLNLGKILQMSGYLKNSVHPSYSPLTAMVGTKMGPRGYARIHQFGGYAGRGKKVKIPERPYLQLTPEEKRAINAAVKEYLLHGTVNALH
jgi:phage virion morphogenesis protein